MWGGLQLKTSIFRARRMGLEFATDVAFRRLTMKKVGENMEDSGKIGRLLLSANCL